MREHGDLAGRSGVNALKNAENEKYNALGDKFCTKLNAELKEREFTIFLNTAIFEELRHPNTCFHCVRSRLDESVPK